MKVQISAFQGKNLSLRPKKMTNAEVPHRASDGETH